MHQLLTTMHTANPAMEDIRQSLDNPSTEADARVLAKEVAAYRKMAADRTARAEAAALMKPKLHLTLRLLSGEIRQGSATLVAQNYEELMRAFLEVFPWHTNEVVVEYEVRPKSGRELRVLSMLRDNHAQCPTGRERGAPPDGGLHARRYGLLPGVLPARGEPAYGPPAEATGGLAAARLSPRTARSHHLPRRRRAKPEAPSYPALAITDRPCQRKDLS